MNKIILILMILLCVSISLAFTPQTDINMREKNLVNGSDINATGFYRDGNALLDNSGFSMEGNINMGEYDVYNVTNINAASGYFEESDTGLSPSGNAVVTIEKDGHSALQFLTNGTQTQSILFGDSDVDIGTITYNHNDNSMSIGTNDATRLNIESDGDFNFQDNSLINFDKLVSDGTICTALPNDDRAGIQTCLDSVGALGGGVVQLLSGNYTIDTRLNISYDNIAMIGEGWNTILIPTFEVAGDTNVITNPVFVEHILLKDFKIDAGDYYNASIALSFYGGISQPTNYTTIDHVWVHNSRGNPIVTGGGYPSFYYFTIKNCLFTKQTMDNGDYIDFSGDWGTFDNNVLISTAISNISQYHIMFTSGTCYNCRITNNYIESTNCSSGLTLETFGKQAGMDTNFHNVIISNNILKNSQIKLSAHSPFWSYGFTNINIVDNEIWNNGLVQEGGSGINFYEYISVDGLKIAGNQIYNPYIGINIPTTETYRNVQIHDNLIIDPTSYPLSIHSNSANSSQNYQIHDNMIIDNTIGINFRNSTIDNMAFYDNIIIGNKSINIDGTTLTNSSFKDDIFNGTYSYKIDNSVELYNLSVKTIGSSETVRVGTHPNYNNYASIWADGDINYMMQADTNTLYLSSEERSGHVYIRNANYNAARLNETLSYFYGNTETPGISKANEFAGPTNWSNLQNYNAYCPAYSAVTGINDSNECTDWWVNINGDNITANSTFDYNNDSDLLNVDIITVNQINASCCLSVGTIKAIDENSISVQPDGDYDDYFTFKSPSDRPTLKREGGKYIYLESSNVYDMGLSLRASDTYSGTLNYEKDNHMMALLGKNSPLGFKANSDYDNYIMIETYDNQPQISVWNGTTLKINDSLEVVGNVTAEEFKADDWSNVTIAGSQVTSGTVADARLSSNVAFTNIINSFGAHNQSFNSDTLFIDADNDEVGIGTSNPLSQLHIADASHVGEARIGGSATLYGLRLHYTQSGSTTSTIYHNPNYAQANSRMYLSGDGTGYPYHIALTGNGLAGVNIQNPTSAWHVNGECNISGVSDTGIGKAVCVKSDGNLGTCTDAINATGYCSCS